MNRKKIIVALALLAPGAVFADDVRIGSGIASPAAARVSGENSYFGLKGEENPLAHLRERVMQYWTPNFGGLNARIAYITDSDAMRLFEQDSETLRVSMNYKYGQASAFVGNDTDWGAASYGPTRSTNRVGASYGFATGTHFGLGLEQMRYNFSVAGPLHAPAAGSVALSDWYVSLAQDVGAEGHVRLSFTRVDGGSAGNVANQLSLGYGQALSDRTEIYALYTRTNNSYNLATNPFGLGMGAGTFGLGVKHSF